MERKQFDAEMVLPRGDIEWNSHGSACSSRDKIVRGVRSICIHSRLVGGEPLGTGSPESWTRAPPRRHHCPVGPIRQWPQSKAISSARSLVAISSMPVPKSKVCKKCHHVIRTAKGGLTKHQVHCKAKQREIRLARRAREEYRSYLQGMLLP